MLFALFAFTLNPLLCLVALALAAKPVVLVKLLIAFTALAGMAGTANLKHTWGTSIKNDSGAAVVADPPLVITGDAEVNVCVTIAASATAEIDAAVAVSAIQSGFVTCTQNADVFTNASDGAGGQHIVLLANKSVAWHTGSVAVNPFTPTITKFFVTNNGSATATFRAGFLLQE